MTPLTPDCGACAALCCMAFAFEPGEAFPLAKPAGAACPKLGPGDRCGVYDDRASLGFHGCIAFDCLGAGQRVTQELFGGRHWRDDPALVGPMIDAFRALRQVHELLELVQVSGRLPLDPAQAAERAALLALLDPAEGWDRGALSAFAAGPLAARGRAYVAGLRAPAEGLRPAPA